MPSKGLCQDEVGDVVKVTLLDGDVERCACGFCAGPKTGFDFAL